jgi:hypothetical protein
MSGSVTALPWQDGLVTIAPDGAICALDPAGRRLWEALHAGFDVEELVAACVRHGGSRESDARRQIVHALRSWRRLGLIEPLPAVDAGLPQPGIAPIRPLRAELALDAAYLVGDRPVRVRCEDPALGALIEAACAFSRAGDAACTLPCVDLIEDSGQFLVRADDAVLASVATPTTSPASARHRCLTALLESSRHGRRWLGILHASAVAAGGKCVLISGQSGAGKSTLSAALVAAGASFVTDDYAPLEQGSWRVWPVPYAPSVKRGSWRLLSRHFPDLHEATVHRHRNLEIRYLELDRARRAPLDEGLPVRALLFPRYRCGSELCLRRIAAPDALTRLCHAASILDRRPGVLAQTLSWIDSVPAFELTYGELDAAVGLVGSLLRPA